MIAVSSPWVDASSVKNEPPRKPADLRDEAREHRPHGGQRGQRHAEHQPERQHVHALQEGDEDRAAEVAADRAVHHLADPVGLRAAALGDQPADAVDEVLTVDEDGDGDDADDGDGDDAADEAAGDLGDAVVGDLLRQLRAPTPGPSRRGRCRAPSRRSAAAPRSRRASGAAGRRTARPRPRPAVRARRRAGPASAEQTDREDGDGEAAWQRAAPLQGVGQRVEGEGDEDADADPRQHRCACWR